MNRQRIKSRGRTSVETKEHVESGVALWEQQKLNTELTSFSILLCRGANRREIRADQRWVEINEASIYGKTSDAIVFLGGLAALLTMAESRPQPTLIANMSSILPSSSGCWVYDTTKSF